MKKIVLMIATTIGLVLISCGLAQKTSESATEKESVDSKLVGNITRNSPNTNSDRDDQNEPLNPPQEHNTDPQPVIPVSPEPDAPKEKPVTQFDTEKLDARVREVAKAFNEDPKTYKLLLRTEDDGTKIYRMIGMHIIVNPQGDIVYLPDEI